MRLNAGRGGQGVQLLLLEESGAFLVEGGVVAVDVPQVAGVRTMSFQVAPSAASSAVMLSKVRLVCARKSPT